MTYSDLESLLTVNVISPGVPVTNPIFNLMFRSMSLGRPLEEVEVPSYGLGARALSGVLMDLRIDVLVIFDTDNLYIFELQTLSAPPSRMSTLLGIADRMFTPGRTNGPTPLIAQYIFPRRVLEPDYESALGRWPTPGEMPPDFGLVAQDVIFVPTSDFLSAIGAGG